MDLTPEFFDFASWNDPHDFRWVRARVIGPSAHALEGEDVLLATEDVRFETRGGAGSAR